MALSFNSMDIAIGVVIGCAVGEEVTCDAAGCGGGQDWGGGDRSWVGVRDRICFGEWCGGKKNCHAEDQRERSGRRFHRDLRGAKFGYYALEKCTRMADWPPPKIQAKLHIFNILVVITCGYFGIYLPTSAKICKGKRESKVLITLICLSKQTEMTDSCGKKT